jgi:hypothetical protein
LGQAAREIANVENSNDIGAHTFCGNLVTEDLDMRDFLLAVVFLVGTILLLGGCLYHDRLLSVEGAAIGVGAVLCVLAAIAKDRIDRDLTL